MQMDERVVLDIEYVNQHRAATFSDYLQYADSLGYSLREVFASEHLQKHLTPLGEQQMVVQVEAAAQHLQARGIPVTQRISGELPWSTENCFARVSQSPLLTEARYAGTAA